MRNILGGKHKSQIFSLEILNFVEFGGWRHLFMDPKREKMISRSSSVVTGFSLHTNNTFSGGFMSASGRSPTWRNKRKKSGRISTTLVSSVEG